MKEEKICPVCGVKFIDGVPYFSFKNTKTTNYFLAIKVCQYSKKEGCINPDYNKENEYPDYLKSIENDRHKTK